MKPFTSLSQALTEHRRMERGISLLEEGMMPSFISLDKLKTIIKEILSGRGIDSDIINILIDSITEEDIINLVLFILKSVRR